MKLLIITQVIDTDHPVLGFFHRWVEEFSKHCEHVHVICLQAGTHSLPDNVTVHSLGKKQQLKKRSFFKEQLLRLSYTIRFYKLIWQLRHEYDNVFVHMNQIYVLLGAPLWRNQGKIIGLWYAHGAVSATLHAAVRLADYVFTSTKEGLRIDTPKRIIVGQGIDTNLFSLDPHRKPNPTLQLITVGRIAQSKNIETLLQACDQLRTQGITFDFSIIGAATTGAEQAYEQRMKSLVSELNLKDHVTWIGAVKQIDLPQYLQQADLFIHDGSTNSLDKTLLEAALCGCVVVSSNPAYQALLGEHARSFCYTPKNNVALKSLVIETMDSQSSKEMSEVRELIKNMSGITQLVSAVVDKY